MIVLRILPVGRPVTLRIGEGGGQMPSVPVPVVPPLLVLVGPPGTPGADGRAMEVQSSATHIQWRFAGDLAWTNLVALSALTGPAGADGVDGLPGTDGRAVELQAGATHIQWRYAGDDVAWTNLVALAALAGPSGADGVDGLPGTDGRAVELQAGATHIQWRYAGDVAWTNLVALSAIAGPAGDDGVDGLPGTNGIDGADGRAVELQAGVTHIQWRLAGDVGWTNLVALSTLTGPAGVDGTDGAQGPAGPQQIFVQETRPAIAGPWTWWVTNGAGQVVNCIINDGIA